MKAAFSAMESKNFVFNKNDGLSSRFVFSSTRKVNKSTLDSGYSRFLFLFGYLLRACVFHDYIKTWGENPSRSQNHAPSCATRGNTAKPSSQITALVLFIRRKSTTWPICKLRHRFSTSRHTIQSKIELILSLIFGSLIFAFFPLFSTTVTHKLHKTLKENQEKHRRKNTWNICDHSFL